MMAAMVVGDTVGVMVGVRADGRWRVLGRVPCRLLAWH